jgi:hypothetical protein
MRVVMVAQYFASATLLNPHPPSGHLLPEGRREFRLGLEKVRILQALGRRELRLGLEKVKVLQALAQLPVT